MTETEPTTRLLTTKELIAQIRTLEQQFPQPTWEEVLPDWKWVHAWMANPARDPDNQFGERWVAVLNEKIVGAGLDPLVLRLTKAQELSVHPDRLVLTYALGDMPW